MGSKVPNLRSKQTEQNLDQSFSQAKYVTRLLLKTQEMAEKELDLL